MTTTQTEAATRLVVPIAPRGAAKLTLAKRGRVTVHFWLRYRQAGGVARSEPFAVTVVGPPPPKPKKPKKPSKGTGTTK